MYWPGILGCFVLLFGPYAIAAAVSIMKDKPQLLVVWLISVFFSFASPLVLAITYASLGDSPTASEASISATFVILQVLIQFPVRLAAVSFWLVIQQRLRTEQQVIVWSRRRFASASCAIGLAFGFTSMLLGGGVLFDATRQLRHYTRGVTAYNLDACPQLPVLLHSTFQSTLLTFCHAAWGVVAGQSYAALWDFGLVAYLNRLSRRWRSSSLTSTITIVSTDDMVPSSSSDNLGKMLNNSNANTNNTNNNNSVQGEREAAADAVDEETTTSPPSFAPRAGGGATTREELEGGCDSSTSDAPANGRSTSGPDGDREEAVRQQNGQPEATPAAPQQRAGRVVRVKPYDGVIPADTVLTAHLDIAFGSLIIVFVLQLVFSALSLLHTGAFSYVTMSEVAHRGCVVSLPLQLVITMVSSLLALWIVRNERVKLD